MKKLELQPIKENIVNTFCEDGLNRNNDVFDFLKLLQTCEGNYSIALNGYWGSGKTFFIKHVHMALVCMNEYVENEYLDSKEKILDILEEAIVEKSTEKLIIPIYYDAWKNDNDTDPISSIIFTIIQQLNIPVGDSAKYALSVEGILSEVSKRFSGMDITKVVRKKDFIQDIKEMRNLDKAIEGFFCDVSVERGNTVVVFIDELDRCRPDFAIKLLERVKHYFNIENVLFVFSTNLFELQHTVSNFYGANFNASRYLDRFFNIKVTLPKVEVSSIYSLNEYSAEGVYEPSSICEAIISEFNMELRDVVKYFSIMEDKSRKRTPQGGSRSAQKIRTFINSIMIPIACALSIVNTTDYFDFIEGRNVQPLIRISEQKNVKGLFEYNITACDEIHTGNENLLKRRIEEVYKAITLNSDEEIRVGNSVELIVTKALRNYFRRMLFK